MKIKDKYDFNFNRAGTRQEELITQIYEGRMVPKDLSKMPVITEGKQDAYFYVDNNGQPARISMEDITTGAIKVVEVEPEDAFVGQIILLHIADSEDIYIFEEKLAEGWHKLYPASQANIIEYDSEGTTLEATNVQDAINELDANVIHRNDWKDFAFDSNVNVTEPIIEKLGVEDVHGALLALMYYIDSEGEIGNVTIEKADGIVGSDTLITYTIKQSGEAIYGPKINIPKDYVLKSATVKVCNVPDTPISGLVVDDKYIDFVINAKTNDGVEEHIYLDARLLTDNYFADSEGTEVQLFIEKTGANTNKISASLVNNSIAQEKLKPEIRTILAQVGTNKSNIESVNRNLGLETGRAINAENNLKSLLDSEGIIREDIDAVLFSWLDSEGNARTLADYNLSSRINTTNIALGNETTRAQAAESNLGGRVSTIESDYLKNSDKVTLQSNITAEENRAKGVEGNLSSLTTAASNLVEAINNEASTRNTKDATLQYNIDSEGRIRAAADSQVLSDAKGYTDIKISTEETRAKSVEGNLSDLTTSIKTNLVAAINWEKQSRLENDALIQNDVTLEATYRNEADLNLSTRITNEIDSEGNIRAAADNALRSYIDSEGTAWRNADSTIQSTITSNYNTLSGNITTVSNTLQAEKTRAQSAEATLNAWLDSEGIIRASADTALGGRINTVEGNITTINTKIPSEATASNQLADKNFVNSSIASATAHFLGTYDVIDDLGLTLEATEAQIIAALAAKMVELEITPTPNDYTFVAFPSEYEEGHIDKFDRYKYTGSGSTWTWLYEYTLNNSSFTAVQWAAINSGITFIAVSQITTNQTNISTLTTNLDTETNARTTADNTLQTNINNITAKIPTAASSSNQLADKTWVTSQLSTSSTNYRNMYDQISGLGLERTSTHEQVQNKLLTKEINPTVNSYVWVYLKSATVTTQIEKYDRYEFNGTSWAYKYTLDNNNFTAVQWNTINSGATSTNIAQITNNADNISTVSSSLQEEINTRTSEVSNLTNSVNAINGKIPSIATSANKLVDTSTANSLINTGISTALNSNLHIFKGLFDVVTDLDLPRTASNDEIISKIAEEVSSPTNNDYVLVSIPNATRSTLIDEYRRFEYFVGSPTNRWIWKYTLKNTLLSSSDIAALDSGIDLATVQKYNSTITAANFICANKLSIGSNQGQAGQVLTSGGSESNISWVTPNTYTTGRGLESSTSGSTITIKDTYTTVSILDSEWETDSQGTMYSVTKSITGVTADSNPVLDVIITPSEIENIDTINEAWGKIFHAETGDGTITFYANGAPEIAITLSIKGY